MTTVSNHISDIDLSKTVLLRKDQVVTHKGIVDATLVQKAEDPRHLFEWFRLPSLEEIDIPAGKSLFFKIDGGWKRADFFEDGRLKGPLTFAIDEIRTPKEAYASLDLNDSGRPIDVVFSWIIVLAMVAAFVLFALFDQPHIVSFVLEICVLLASLATVVVFARTPIQKKISIWRGNEECLEKLKDLYKGPQMV